MRDLFMLCAFIGMIPFILIRPFIGVLLWGWVAIIVPNYLVYGYASSIRYNYIIAILTILSWLFHTEKEKIHFDGTTLLILIFGLWGTLSAFTSISDSPSVMIEWTKFIKILFFSFIITALLTTRLHIHSLLLIISISLGYYGVVEGLKFILSAGAHHVWGPGMSVIGDNNHLALALIMLLPMIYYLYSYSENKLVKFSYLGSFIVTTAAVLGTYSRGGFIGFIAISSWLLLKSKQRVKLLMLFVPLSIFLIYLVPETWIGRMDTITTADQENSFMGRVIAWKLSTLIALDNPFLGGGFHAVQDLPVWLYYSAYFDKFDFIPTDLPDTLMGHAAHSIYFQIAGDMGFVGLFLFLLILYRTWASTEFVYKHSSTRSDLYWAKDLSFMLKISLIAYCVSGAALSMAYFDLYFAIVAIVIVLQRIVKKVISEEIQTESSFSEGKNQ